MDIDRRIAEKRSEIREAFDVHRKARETAAAMRTRLSELLVTAREDSATRDPEALERAQAQVQELESAERNAADRFQAISDELSQLHREKFGEWRFPWIGPRP
jgi:hypothetical protein